MTKRVGQRLAVCFVTNRAAMTAAGDGHFRLPFLLRRVAPRSTFVRVYECCCELATGRRACSWMHSPSASLGFPEIVSRRDTKGTTKHLCKCALARVAYIERHRGDRPAFREIEHGLKAAGLSPSLPEGQVRLPQEDSLDRARAGAHRARPVGKKTRIQRRDDVPDTSVVRSPEGQGLKGRRLCLICDQAVQGTTREVFRSKVPAGSSVVPGALPELFAKRIRVM
jgi:hypothetical protein